MELVFSVVSATLVSPSSPLISLTHLSIRHSLLTSFIGLYSFKILQQFMDYRSRSI